MTHVREGTYVDGRQWRTTIAAAQAGDRQRAGVGGEAPHLTYTPEGNFAAFAKHLPRLKDMGVKILWLMPVTPISIEKRQGTLGSYYACSSYTAIKP